MGDTERAAGASALNRRGSPNKKRRQKQYDPLKPVGGYAPEATSLFEKLIHHPKAFGVVSVIGGAVFLAGILLAFNPPSTTRTLPNAARPQDAAVRDGSPAASGSPAADALTGTPGPTGTPAPQRQYDAAPPFTIDPTATYVVTLHTDKGDVTLQLDAKSAPQTVNNFVYLAQNRFYDGLSFQRVVQGLLAQAGAPQVDGSGGPGYTIPTEDSPLKHVTGAIAMAQQAGVSNSAASQFYVCLANLSQQDGQDTVFGKVTQGLDILQALPTRNPATDSNAPALGINSVSVSKQ